jgi:hypothetical protein
MGPVFMLNEKMALGVFGEMENLSDFRIYLAEKNFGKGFVLDQYVGYLPEGRSTNANETVYEVVCFS